MIEILPIRLLNTDDAPLFGPLAVSLGKLTRMGIPVAAGIAITPPNLKLKTTLEHFDFGKKEVFQQSLELVKKEINATPVPDVLQRETGKHKWFLLNGQKIKGVKALWLALLSVWVEQIKLKLWHQGFYVGITEGLDAQTVIFINKFESFGVAFFDPLQDDVVIRVKVGKPHPNDLKKIVEAVEEANKKLFIPHEYEWIVDRGVKIVGIKPYTQNIPVATLQPVVAVPLSSPLSKEAKIKSAVKVFFDLSSGLTIEKNIDGVYISSEKIFDLNKPKDSFEHLVFKIVESAVTFPHCPIFVKLADKSEGAGRVRGALRLIHQKSLFEPIAEALDFARHKKNLTNVHVVIPFTRRVSELLQLKRDLAVKKLMRKNSLQLWAELAVPENIINIEDYLIAGIDGVVLNLDELVAHLNGFDPKDEEVAFYKNEVDGLMKFLEDSIKLMHKSKIPFIAYGSLSFYPKVLEFLVEKGVYGVVAERYEAHSAYDLLHQTERRMILRKS